MKTLIILDIQNDFMPNGSLAVPHSDLIIPTINNILDKFDLVVATQDWHPENHNSFAANHINKKPFEKINLHGQEQTLWPNHCIQGSVGAEFPPNLEIRPIAAIFRKGMDKECDSYSGFYDNNHKNCTGLAAYLREKGANDLYFCGLCADICVYYTINDALNEGFKCWLIEDATRPLDEVEFQRVKNELLSKSVSTIQSTEI